MRVTYKNFKVGQVWADRKGQKQTVVDINYQKIPGKRSPYRILTEFKLGGVTQYRSYTENGEYTQNEAQSDDLVTLIKDA